MKPKTIWIISAILLLADLAIQYLAYIKVDLSDSLGLFGFLLDIFSNLFLIIAIGAILGLLFGLIPYKEKSFKEKFKTTLPLGISTILIVLIVIFSFAIFTNNSLKNRSSIKYDDITIPQTLSCLNIHEGKFETKNILIRRNGNRQIQINKLTKEEKEFAIEWLSDCEYHLSRSNTSEKLKVKIVSITDTTYECYVIPEKESNKYPVRQIINIIK
jgi:hypothetical protein